MEKDIASLLDLPWSTLFTLASGYTAYLISNLGLRDHHKPIDIAFSTLVYGLVARIVFDPVIDRGEPQWLASIVGFFFALVVAISWNRYGRKIFRLALRKMDVSLHDELPSAWMTMLATKDVNASQLIVKLTNGTWLMCEDLHQFKDEPNGPCALGIAGDVLMYVTHQKGPEDKSFSALPSVIDPEWGSEALYLASDKIERVYFRRNWR